MQPSVNMQQRYNKLRRKNRANEYMIHTALNDRDDARHGVSDLINELMSKKLEIQKLCSVIEQLKAEIEELKAENTALKAKYFDATRILLPKRK